MIKRTLKSVLFRANWARLGVWFFRSCDFQPSVVKVAGRRIKLSSPPGEREAQEYELGEIYFNDCYRLYDVSPASEACYEPNRSLAPLLERHLNPLGVTIFHEAVDRLVALST
jgi:hypothetical protein